MLYLLHHADIVSSSPRFGAGFILGDPSGLTGKVIFNPDNAAAFGIGASARDGFYVYADYLRHFGGLFPFRELELFIGAGVGLHSFEHDHRPGNDEERENSLEVRVPVGLEYIFNQVPLGIFIELAPALELVPDIDFHLRGGLGLRYYF